ncbi:hypothetical protein [Streptomyces sp. DH37]|uniref:hypothetical protein n=1 Tax=Streptomyces sp. DH37 TaxID=3040122 RepID=UPI0024429EFA|nr:hypothetical protein [Streptomyces sp. DH37]MDG9702034.1 hypothetical protein [Streptomyces sp. DH37]
MPGVLVFVLVVVAVHALGAAIGGWAVLQENHGRREHGQEPLMPMGVAWFVALFGWGTAVLQSVCVVRARKRRPWIRAVLAVWLVLVAFSTALALIGSLAAGSPGLGMLVVLGVDVAALWVVLGETARRWFSVRGPSSASARG